MTDDRIFFCFSIEPCRVLSFTEVQLHRGFREGGAVRKRRYAVRMLGIDPVRSPSAPKELFSSMWVCADGNIGVLAVVLCHPL